MSFSSFFQNNFNSNSFANGWQFGGKNLSSANNAALNAAIGAAGALGGTAISNGYNSDVGSAFSSLGNIASAIPGPWGAALGLGLNVVGGLANRAFGAKWNQENINRVEGNINALKNFQSNAGSWDQLQSNIETMPSQMTFSNSYIGSNGWFNHKADNKANKLRSDQSVAFGQAQRAVTNNAGNIATNQAQTLARNYASYGGPINLLGDGVMSPFGSRFAKGGILNNPLSSNGADWNIDLTSINNGGRHEQNPYEGVQIGVDQEGTPNLVEEGEVIWNNYVFSNRMKVPKALREQLKLGNRDITYAEAVKSKKKEREERPNDPIEKRGFEAFLQRLGDSQEEQRQKQEARRAEREARKAQAQQAIMGALGLQAPMDAMQQQGVPDDQMTAETPQEQGMPYARGGQMGNIFDGWGWYPNNLTRNWFFGNYNNPSEYNYDDDPILNHMKWMNGRFDRQPLLTVNNNGSYVANPPLLQGETAQRGVKRSAWDSFDNSLSVGQPIKVKKGTKDEALGQPVIDWLNSLYRHNNESGDYSRLLKYMYGDNIPAEYSSDPSRLIEDAGLAKNRNIYNSIMNAYGQPVLGSDNKPTYWVNDVGDRLQNYNIGDFRRRTLQGLSSELGPDLGRTLPTSGIELPTNEQIKVAANTDLAQAAEDVKNAIAAKGITEDDDNGISWLANLRYLPALGNTISVFSDLMGWTNKPDYSNANAVLEASRGIRDVRFNPIGDYLTYRPLDRMFAQNQLNAQTGATQRNIINTSGNRGTALAGLLASGYNANNTSGNLFRQAQEYNEAQRQQVANFNRETNKFNSQMDLEAQRANLGASEVRMNAALNAARLRDAVDERAGLARSANLTNFFDSIGDIGREEFTRNMINSNRAQYYTIDMQGGIHYKSGFYSLPKWERDYYEEEANRRSRDIQNNGSRRRYSNGGYLTIKRR